MWAKAAERESGEEGAGKRERGRGRESKRERVDPSPLNRNWAYSADQRLWNALEGFFDLPDQVGYLRQVL